MHAKRRPSRWLLPLFLLGLLGAWLPPRPALASCAASTPEQWLARATTVFRGRVIALDPEMASPGTVYFGPRRVTFQVDTGWKGPVTATMVVTENASGVGAAEIRWQHGEDYLVYTRGSRQEGLETDICFGTVPIRYATEHLRSLGSGTPAATDPPPGLPNTGGHATPSRLPLTITIVAMTALAGAGLLWRRRLLQRAR